jgi:hypothetical protein
LHASVDLAEKVNFVFKLRNERLNLRLDLVHSGVSQSFRIDYPTHLLYCTIKVVVDDHVMVMANLCQLRTGILQPNQQPLAIFALPCREPRL